MSECPNCKERIYPDDTFCGNCGASLQPTMTPGLSPPPIPPTFGGQIPCPTCGHMNEPDAIYCEVDGTPLKAGQPTPIPPPPTGPIGILIMPDQMEVDLSEDQMTFGRDRFFKYVKEDQVNEVSRRHFTITRANGGYSLQDGGPDPDNPQAWKQSVNRTFLNGNALQTGEKQQLKSNDTIDVAGLVRLTFKTR